MRLLSCKLAMSESFNRENFYGILVKWLGSASSYAGDMGAKFNAEANKASAKLETEYCRLETITIEKYSLFKLTNRFYEQCWETQAVFFEGKGSKYVAFHIDCSGDTSRFAEIPLMRTDIIRAFVSSGMLAKTLIPIRSEPVIADESLKRWLLDTVNGKTVNDLPVVFASKIEGIIGYDVDEVSLSKKLAGLAIVVLEGESDFAFSLKAQTGGILPYNGYIGVFYPDSRNNKIYKRKSGAALESEIVDEIVKFVTARTDEDKIDWDALDTKEQKELVVLLDDKSENLENELKEAKRRIAELEAKNLSLQSYAEQLKQANGLIQTTDEGELFEFEQYDLIVSCLEAELKNCAEGSRKRDLLNGLLNKNPLKGTGKEIYDRAKGIISRGKLGERDLAELAKLGFENLSDNKHYRFVFRADMKHKLTFVNTPSDVRSGQNLASNILNTISVYKK